MPPGMHVDRSHPGAAQLLTERVGETTDGEFRRAVSTLVGHPGEAEDAGGVHDRTGVLFDENRQERARAVDDTTEVDVPQPVIVVDDGVENAGTDSDTRIVEHRAKRCRRPVPHLTREVALSVCVANVEHPRQARTGEARLGLLQTQLIDIGEGHRSAVSRESLCQRTADA